MPKFDITILFIIFVLLFIFVIMCYTLANPSKSHSSRYTPYQEGFGSSIHEESQKLDIFGGMEGSKDCSEINSLSTSTGYICYNEEQRRLMTTRGGNYTTSI